MFCPKCGKETAENQAFCANCGAPLAKAEAKQETPAVGSGVSRPGSGNATAGLVLGIIGLIFSLIVTPIGFLTSLAGVICSALGLKSKHTRAKVGLGLSIAGMVISIATWALVGLWILALL